MRCPGLPSLRIMRRSMEDSSCARVTGARRLAPRTDRIWPRRRRPARRIRRRAPRPAARRSAGARPRGGRRGRVRRSCRPRPGAGVRSACTGRRRGVHGAADCIARAPSGDAAPGRARHRACRRPCRWRSGRARTHAASRRRVRKGCARTRAAPSRTSGTGSRRYARRSAAGSVRVRRTAPSPRPCAACRRS